jgi:hypothetical protein
LLGLNAADEVMMDRATPVKADTANARSSAEHSESLNAGLGVTNNFLGSWPPAQQLSLGHRSQPVVRSHHRHCRALYANEVISGPQFALALIDDLLGPLNLAATFRTGPASGELFDPDRSMAHLTAIETDASPIPPMKPPLARLESLFSAARQSCLPKSVSVRPPWPMLRRVHHVARA